MYYERQSTELKGLVFVKEDFSFKISNHSLDYLSSSYDKYVVDLSPGDRLIGVAARDLGKDVDTPCFEFKILVGRMDQSEESKEEIEESKS